MIHFASTSFSPSEMQALLDFRRKLHQHPELSEQEQKTTAQIRAALFSLGLEELDLGLPTGVAAILRGKQHDAAVLLRADIDALPVEESTEWAYSSQIPGTMHACGHDVHLSLIHI